jgi:hypothetical protein
VAQLRFKHALGVLQVEHPIPETFSLWRVKKLASFSGAKIDIGPPATAGRAFSFGAMAIERRRAPVHYFTAPGGLCREIARRMGEARKGRGFARRFRESQLTAVYFFTALAQNSIEAQVLRRTANVRNCPLGGQIKTAVLQQTQKEHPMNLVQETASYIDGLMEDLEGDGVVEKRKG